MERIAINFSVGAPNCVCLRVFIVWLPSRFPALEQKRGLSVGVGARPGEAQRLSSLTFGCFQVRGKSPQVLTGPEPSQRTVSAQPLREEAEWGGGNSGENSTAVQFINNIAHFNAPTSVARGS